MAGHLIVRDRPGEFLRPRCRDDVLPRDVLTDAVFGVLKRLVVTGFVRRHHGEVCPTVRAETLAVAVEKNLLAMNSRALSPGQVGASSRDRVTSSGVVYESASA
jgi:hypothetical protein